MEAMNRPSLVTCVSPRAAPRDNTRDRLHEFGSQAGLEPICEPRNLLRDRTTHMSCERCWDNALPDVDPQGQLVLVRCSQLPTLGARQHSTRTCTHMSIAKRGGTARDEESAKPKVKGRRLSALIASASCPWPLRRRVGGDRMLSTYFAKVQAIVLTKRELQDKLLLGKVLETGNLSRLDIREKNIQS